MRQFTDTKERVWDVELNVRQMKRVRDVLGIDLVNVIQTNKDGSVATDTIDRVANDPILLCDILWVLCEQQAKLAPLRGHPPGDGQLSAGGYGVTDAPQGTRRLSVVATRGEATNPKRKRGRARWLFLKKAVDLARKYETENLEVLEKALASPEFEERLKTSLIPPAASRESAESTPALSP